MLLCCWSTVVDGGPRVNQRWASVSYFLGCCCLLAADLIVKEGQSGGGDNVWSARPSRPDGHTLDVPLCVTPFLTIIIFRGQYLFCGVTVSTYIIRFLICKAKRQYLLTCKVSRHCFSALHGMAVWQTLWLPAWLPAWLHNWGCLARWVLEGCLTTWLI